VYIGSIELQGVCLRYRADLPLVLNQVTFSVAPCDKVGVVGRTGAGKSSLVVALLRLVELEAGKVFIDGVDISGIGLHALRSGMAVIPQDPVLFSGTVRSNLDPFGRFGDVQLWEALQRARLGSHITALEDCVQEGGAHFRFALPCM
jgi:ATP-binding cassette subfamily C (CFTR/MRP) protein 1